MESPHFFMRQTSDVTTQNCFDHCVFVSKIPIVDIMKQDMSATMFKNKIVTNKYISWFITDKLVKNNSKLFNKQKGMLDQFTVIDSYDDLFAGFLRIENFIVLVNSENIE
jgi:hypothetical protein